MTPYSEIARISLSILSLSHVMQKNRRKIWFKERLVANKIRNRTLNIDNNKL